MSNSLICVKWKGFANVLCHLNNIHRMSHQIVLSKQGKKDLTDAFVKIWALDLLLFCLHRNAGAGMEWHPLDWENLWRGPEHYYSTEWGSRNMCKTVSFSPSFCFHFFLAFHGFWFFFFFFFNFNLQLLRWNLC